MNGYLIRPQSQTVSGESNIPLYDAKGNLERQGRITHPGAAKIILLDAAVTPNRIILGAATAYTDETTVSFVAKTDRDGEEVETVGAWRFLADANMPMEGERGLGLRPRLERR